MNCCIKEIGLAIKNELETTTIFLVEVDSFKNIINKT
jgi:hypothetical protein